MFPGDDPLETAVTIWAEVHGLITLFRTGRFGQDAEVFRGIYRQSVDRMLRGNEKGDGEEWVAFAPPEFDRLVQRAVERVFKLLDLPRRSDIEALNKNLERVATALEGLERGAPAAAADPSGLDESREN